MRLWVTHSTDRLAESTEKQAKKNQLYSSYFMFVPYLPSTEVKKCWKLAVMLTFPYNIEPTELSLTHFP